MLYHHITNINLITDIITSSPRDTSLVNICMADSMCLISCATSRGDGDFRTKLQDIMDDGGDAPSIAVITVLIHPKKWLRDLKSKKRKAEDIVARMTTRTRTEVAGTSVFEIKRDHCLWQYMFTHR